MTHKQQESRSDIDLSPLLAILKNVSRSFYLSIRILPQEARHAICLAYLFARAADSIADSPEHNNLLKTELICELRTLLNQHDLPRISELQNKALPLLSKEIDEQNLIKALPDVYASYNTLSQQEATLVRNVVSTLISGMLEDMQKFSSANLQALKTKDDLDQYTYLVAGCVGEFWTEILDLHYGKILNWNATQQVAYGIRFGKALQLTNILRDIKKDAQIGRCYLPEEDLFQHNLQVNKILSQDQLVIQQIIPKYLNLAYEHYAFAEKYYFNIPKKAIRLRLAALWPIVIGLKTLSLIKAQSHFDTPVKISRNQVYKLLLLSPVFALSNSITSWYLKKLKQ